MRCVGHVATMSEIRNAYTILIGNLKGRAEDLSVDGSIILKWILKN
jgi:hypothetical protein